MKVISSLSEVNFTVSDAAQAGYRIHLEKDGQVDIRGPKKGVYHIRGFRCDCQDAKKRNGGSFQLPNGSHICKHTVLALQVYPCQYCGRAMVLVGEYFECSNPACRAAIDREVVRQRRQGRLRGTEQTKDLEANPEAAQAFSWPPGSQEAPSGPEGFVSAFDLCNQLGTYHSVWAAVKEGALTSREVEGTVFVKRADAVKLFGPKAA